MGVYRSEIYHGEIRTGIFDGDFALGILLWGDGLQCGHQKRLALLKLCRRDCMIRCLFLSIVSLFPTEVNQSPWASTNL